MAVSDRGEPASVLDVKAGDEALVYLENMPDGLIEKHFALKSRTGRSRRRWSIWTWVGLDADTKLVASFYIGGRDGGAALMLMDDLARRFANRVCCDPRYFLQVKLA
jgi:hypothetical protein